MKPLFLALTTLGISTITYPALPASTDPTLVAVPQLPGGFFVGGFLGYLQPISTNGDLDYASINLSTGSLFFSELRGAQPSFDYAWGANVGYEFPFAARDLNLKYFHFDSDDTESVFSFPFSISPVNFIPNLFLPGFMTIAERTRFDLNQLDLLAGQYLDIGCRLILHPNVGLRWVDFERKFETADFQPFITLPFFNYLNTNEESDFDGIGPIAGLDASYYLGTGIGVVGHLDCALVVGDIDSKLNSDAIILAVVTGAENSYNFDFEAKTNTRIVPIIDGKLGVDYTYLFNCRSNAYLTAEVGYQVSQYFNIIDRIGGTTSINTIGVAFLTSITDRNTADFNINGPYINLTLHV